MTETPDVLRVFVVFLCPLPQANAGLVAGTCHECFLQILSISSFVSHLTIRRCIKRMLKAVKKITLFPPLTHSLS
jgi:hypothetical protein